MQHSNLYKAIKTSQNQYYRYYCRRTYQHIQTLNLPNFSTLDIDTSLPKASRKMHRWVYPHCIYSNATFSMCENTLQNVGSRRAAWPLRIFQAMNKAGHCPQKVTRPTYKLWCVQRMTYYKCISLQRSTSRKNEQEPSFMTAEVISELYESCSERLVEQLVDLLHAENFG